MLVVCPQEGESTPGISGYFEVEVGGQLVHSKKVRHH